MLKTNPLTKPITSVSLAIGVATVASLGSSILVAPSAQAAIVGYNGPADGILTEQPITILDKTFSNFEYIEFNEKNEKNENVFLSTNHFIISETAGSWSVNLSFNNGVGVGPNDPPKTYAYRYKISIDPATNFTFKTVEFDTLVDTIGRTKPVSGTKTIHTNTGKTITLNSINGNSDFVNFAPDVKWITVTDSITVTGVLKGVTNNFTQKEVPEPGTVLGILAVGGIGFISRFRKQK